MKVSYENTIKYSALQKVKQLPGNIILREDLDDLGSPRQVSRATQALVDEGILAKLGYGVYGKLARSSITGDSYLPQGFVPTAREALTKLGVRWQSSQVEQDYYDGTSTQIPVNPPTKLLTRFRRKLSYNGMELRVE